MRLLRIDTFKPDGEIECSVCEGTIIPGYDAKKWGMRDGLETITVITCLICTPEGMEWTTW